MRESTGSFATLLVASLSFCDPSLPAQTPVRLIGITTNPAAVAPLSLRQDPSSCNTVTCALGLPPIPTAYAGGTAYDPRKPAVWMTNGTMLGAFDPDTCAALCAPQPVAPITGNALATGLALNENTNLMFMSDSANVIYWFQASCPLVAVSKCVAPVPIAGQIIAGLATSDVQKLLFYSASSFGAAAAQNSITVAMQSAPCQPLCRVQLPNCPGVVLGPITGLAYDDCKRLLWATDGLFEIAVSIIVASTGCSIQQVACCKIPGGERYAGLCLQPSQPTSLGASCTSVPCPACPAMVHAPIGDPSLGNPAFALTLQNAPANAPSVMLVSVGSCMAPGIPFPAWCGTLKVPLPIGFGLSSPTGGGVGCTGGVNFGLAIPLAPALCNIPLASQFFLICPGAVGTGTGVSNCLTWMITGT